MTLLDRLLSFLAFALVGAPDSRTFPGRRLLHVLGAAGVLAALLGAASPAVAQYDVQGCQLVWAGTGSGQTTQSCYREQNLRPVYPLTDCPGAEKDGALCYPFCRAGYNGVGPVCWQNCPAGYIDDGAFCRRNAVIISADNSACPWYDKCGLTFARGCSRCPAGYANDGCTCRIDVHIFAKDTYSRPGTSLSCAPGRERIGALCYGTCPSGFSPSGIYCVATQETCRDVPVEEPRPPLFPFCFKLVDPASSIRPCFTLQTFADEAGNARDLAQCQCVGCQVESIGCDFLSSACGS